MPFCGFCLFNAFNRVETEAIIAYLTSYALSVESPAQLLWELKCIHSLAVLGDGEDLRNETYFEGLWVELSWLF